MSKNAGSLRSAENLLQVAGFLRQADKLVRDRNYQLALEQISKARAKDPTNSYAEAYEQRVQLLLSALNEKKMTSAGSKNTDPVAPHSFSQHLESIANLAIQEAHRTANLTLRQQTLDMRQDDRQLHASANFLHAPKNEKETLGSKEAQIRRCISSAEELFHDRRLDEALNILAPAILLDPLNEAVLRLERQIRDTQEEDWMVRSGRYRKDVEATKPARDEDNTEIQKCILWATHLADRKEFSEALMVLGQGYLLDPFSVTLATCEKMILTAIGRETSIPEWQPATRKEASLEDKPGPSETKQSVFELLDNALDYLDEDRFAESLSQVALAMIATQNENKSEQQNQSNPVQIDKAHREIADPGNGFKTANQGADDVSRQVFVLMDKAKRLASKQEFESALEELLGASFLIPSDGSLEQLDREVARKFMEYYQLLRPDRILRSGQRPSTSVPDLFVSSGDGNLKKHDESPIGSTPETVQRREHSSRRIERRIEFDDSSNNTPEERISRTREHLLRCLGHLNNMRLIEASVEAEIASLADDSRRDIGSFALAVAGLSRKAKAQIPLDALTDMYDSIRQKAKDLIHNLWYEEIVIGINRGLDMLPQSDILRKRREEVVRSFEESKHTATIAQEMNGDTRESSKGNPPTSRKFKKRSFDQMGLSFSDNLDLSEESDESRSEKNSDATEMLPVQKPMRRGSHASSGSAYLGN